MTVTINELATKCGNGEAVFFKHKNFFISLQINTDVDGAYVGIHDQSSRATEHDLVIGVKDKKPFIQVAKEGRVRSFDLMDVLEKIDKL